MFLFIFGILSYLIIRLGLGELLFWCLVLAGCIALGKGTI